MMSGFGDHRTPRKESIALMEEMVIEYLTVLVAKVCFFHFATEFWRFEREVCANLVVDMCCGAFKSKRTTGCERR